MSFDANPALVHIRRLELRIEQQTHSIERLQQLGEDPSAALHRLKLLRRALDEMRIQLGQLSPTNLGQKRPEIEALRFKLDL